MGSAMLWPWMILPFSAWCLSVSLTTTCMPFCMPFLIVSLPCIFHLPITICINYYGVHVLGIRQALPLCSTGPRMPLPAKHHPHPRAAPTSPPCLVWTDGPFPASTHTACCGLRPVLGCGKLLHASPSLSLLDGSVGRLPVYHGLRFTTFTYTTGDGFLTGLRAAPHLPVPHRTTHTQLHTPHPAYTLRRCLPPTTLHTLHFSFILPPTYARTTTPPPPRTTPFPAPHTTPPHTCAPPTHWAVGPTCQPFPPHLHHTATSPTTTAISLLPCLFHTPVDYPPATDVTLPHVGAVPNTCQGSTASCHGDRPSGNSPLQDLWEDCRWRRAGDGRRRAFGTCSRRALPRHVGLAGLALPQVVMPLLKPGLSHSGGGTCWTRRRCDHGEEDNSCKCWGGSVKAAYNKLPL